jgi:hypothetical protein
LASLKEVSEGERDNIFYKNVNYYLHIIDMQEEKKIVFLVANK